MTKNKDKYPDRLEKLLKKSLKEIHSDHSFTQENSCALWGASTVDAEEISLHTNTACHAGLNYAEQLGVNQKNPPEYIFDFIVNYSGRREENSEEVHLAFADFIMNRSWLQKAYISKDAGRVWKDFCYVMDPKVNRNYLTQAMVMNRCHAENDNVLRAWYAMVENGIEENVALILAHTWKVGKDKNDWVVSLTLGHCAISGSHSMDTKISTLSYLATDKWKKDLYTDVQRYSKICAACGDDRDGFNKDVEAIVDEKMAKDGDPRWPNSPLVAYTEMYRGKEADYKKISLAGLKKLEHYMLEKADLNWKL